MIHYFAKTGFQKFGSYGSTYSVGMSLSERTGGIFNTSRHIEFGMSRSNAFPLTELLQIFHRVFSGECKYRI